MRPFKNGVYHDFKWRGWWDFGTGALGDIGCHSMDWPWWALNLTAPTSVEAVTSEKKAETAPLWSNIVYEFPANGDRPPLKLYWYDGRNKDTPATAPEYESVKKLSEMTGKQRVGDNGNLYVGDKGMIMVEGGGPIIMPASRRAEFKRPEKTIPRITTTGEAQHQDWLNAIRSGNLAGSNFQNYAGPLAEAVLLGNLAVRLGKKIQWDSQSLKATNAPEADSLIRREYRKGWDVA